MNKYLSYDKQRGPKVREMFSRLAWRYDLVNDVMSFGLHRGWKRQTVALAANGRKTWARWLDLCCGTGDMCFLAETAGGAGARVVGADFTLPMLAVASRRRRTPCDSRSRTGRSTRSPLAMGFATSPTPKPGSPRCGACSPRAVAPSSS